MVACPTCHAAYPPGTRSCAIDGALLVPDERVTLPAAPPGPSLPDALVDTTVAGRYKIVRKIGEGGMGAVYEARHTVIGKRVAVKVLLEKLHDKSSFVARLLQEARLASSIGHENIVDVTDFGTTEDGRSFVVMEYLEGEALGQLITREAPLPVERCLRICHQVASALGAAHAKGIVHRDIKPENVYLVRRGDTDFVKVVDFGISKAVRGGEDNPELQRLTHTSMVLGTPLYMSPEQARGEENVDHRADVWALGVMLYECLTGEVPFRANNYLGIIAQVQNHHPPSPGRLRPELGIPEAVESVVMRALEKDRASRYQLMSDLDRDLDRLLAGDQNVGTIIPIDLPAPAAAAPIRSGRRWPLAVLAVLAVGVGVAVSLSSASETQPTAAKEATAVVAPPPPSPAVRDTMPPPPPIVPAPPRTAGPPESPPEARRPPSPTSSRRREKPEPSSLPRPASPPSGVVTSGGDRTPLSDQAYGEKPK